MASSSERKKRASSERKKRASSERKKRQTIKLERAHRALSIATLIDDTFNPVPANAVLRSHWAPGTAPVARLTGRNQLMFAAAKGPFDKFSAILASWPYDVDMRSSHEETALMFAAERPDGARFIRMLCDYGADPNLKDKDGETPLIHALNNEKEMLENVKTLLECGADPKIESSRRETVLLLSAEFGHVQSMRLFLEAGADPNVSDWRGRTALMLVAAMPDNSGIIRILCDAGAELDIKDEYDGFTALMLTAMDPACNDNMRTLLTCGANPNVTDDEGNTALIHAIKYLTEAKEAKNNKAAVKILLEAGADPNIDSPLYWAMRQKNSEIVKMLLQAGANPDHPRVRNLG